MGPRRQYSDLKNYSQNLIRKQNEFACPRCREEILPKDFEDHCADHHDIDPKRACVWCLGEKSWPSRKKNQNADHLISCFEKFISTQKVLTALDARKNAAAAAAAKPTRYCTPLPLDEKLCPARDFFGHEADYILNSLPPQALDETFSLLPLDPPSLVYTDEHLNVAASCVEKYLATRETHEWFHVMIRAVAYRSFLAALDGECGTLPFSCWCDGGRHDEPRHRQHRHLLLAAPNGHFESTVWKKVVCGVDDAPGGGNYKCKHAKPIEGPMHLVNTLGYLGRRRSRCAFTLKNGDSRDNHFYILNSLPLNYRRPLVVLWDEGLKLLMYQVFFQNVSIERLLIEKNLPEKNKNGQYRLRIGHFYGLERGFALPLDRRYVPVDRATPYRAHLLNGKTLHFEIRPEPLDEEAWIEAQALGENCFYDNVEDEWWIPRPKYQEMLNLVVPRETKIEDLAKKNDALNEENVRLKKEKDELNEENVRLKKDNDEMKEEIVRLMKKIENLYESENKMLKAKVEKLESENAALRAQVGELQMRLWSSFCKR